MVEKENTPTITGNLNVGLLRQNFDKVRQVASEVPSSEKIVSTLRTVNGYTDYHQIGMTDEQFKETMKICCYIRNRFTLLRLMCDYRLFDFDKELTF